MRARAQLARRRRTLSQLPRPCRPSRKPQYAMRLPTKPGRSKLRCGAQTPRRAKTTCASSTEGSATNSTGWDARLPKIWISTGHRSYMETSRSQNVAARGGGPCPASRRRHAAGYRWEAMGYKILIPGELVPRMHQCQTWSATDGCRRLGAHKKGRRRARRPVFEYRSSWNGRRCGRCWRWLPPRGKAGTSLRGGCCCRVPPIRGQTRIRSGRMRATRPQKRPLSSNAISIARSATL